MRRFFRIFYIALTWLLTGAVLAVIISSTVERGEGEPLLSFIGLRFSVTGVGASISFLTIALFTVFWNAAVQPRKPGKRIPLSIWINSIGFGLLPGAAVLKAFDHTTTVGKGIPLFEPLPALPFVTKDGCFSPSRIEFILALFCFAAIICWLASRKKDIPGNGDLMLAVLCVWGMIRAGTETLRAAPLFQAASVNLVQIVFLFIADIPLCVWTLRMGRKQKSTAFAALEWAAVISCETVMVLNTCGVLTSGSGIGDLAVNTGCLLLSMLLILLAGKDSRE